MFEIQKFAGLNRHETAFGMAAFKMIRFLHLEQKIETSHNNLSQSIPRVSHFHTGPSQALGTDYKIY